MDEYQGMGFLEVLGQVFAWTMLALLAAAFVYDIAQNGDHSAPAVMADRIGYAAQSVIECPIHITVDYDRHCVSMGIGR